ncbi:MAG: dihydropteroate synthase [Breznakibacter sp.]
MFHTAPFKTIKAKGKLIDLGRPVVMGILNTTPDSFYRSSRHQTAQSIADMSVKMVNDGAAILDIGGYSSRPGAGHISAEEEIRRLDPALTAIKDVLPHIPVSVNTFRSSVARQVVENFGVDIINDISGGMADGDMFSTVARLRVGYVLMHMVGTPQTMQQNPYYQDVVKEVTLFLSQQLDKLAWAGVTDVIIDPGFGFAKTVEHNYQLMARLDELKLFDQPLLVGISRKSMIYNILGNDPGQALNGTTVLNTVALQKGADILRVHDVKEAAECINLVETLQKSSNGVS